MLEENENYILIDACAYCFGPAGTMDSIISGIEKKYKIILIGIGTTLELLKKNKRISEFYEVDTENLEDLDRHKSLIKNAKLVLCNTNPVMAAYAKFCGCIVFCIDILPWMNQSLEDKIIGIKELYNNSMFLANTNIDIMKQLKNVDMYYLQSYFIDFDIDSRIKNYQMIAPLVPKEIYCSKEKEKHNTLVVSTGGLVNPDINGTEETLFDFVRILVECSMNFAEKYDLNRVYLCGPQILEEKIKDRYNGKLVVGSFAHDDFISMMRESKYVAFVPGLTTMYESFLLGSRSLLLPPTNCSQVLQLDAINKSDLSGELICWDVDDELVFLCQSISEVETAEKLCKLLKEWINNGEMERMLLNGFNKLFSSSDDSITEKRYRVVKDMGENAIDYIAKDINNIMG